VATARRTKRLQFLAVGLLALFFALPAAAKPPDPCAALPKPVVNLMTTRFPGWRPKQLSDLDADARRVWENRHGPECPGIAVGHFESLDQVSYAVLLVPQSDPVGGFKLVEVDKSRGTNVYGWNLIDQLDSRVYSGTVISKAPPGNYSQVDNPAISATIRLDGVYFGLIDKGSVLYYWSDGRFQKLILSA
jgi:hypothetical protein